MKRLIIGALVGMAGTSISMGILYQLLAKGKIPKWYLRYFPLPVDMIIFGLIIMLCLTVYIKLNEVKLRKDGK